MEKTKRIIVILLILCGVLSAEIIINSNTTTGFTCTFNPDKPAGDFTNIQPDPSFETAIFALPGDAHAEISMRITSSSQDNLDRAPVEFHEAFIKPIGKMRNISMGLMYLPTYYKTDDGSIRRIESAEITVDFNGQFAPEKEFVESNIYDDVYENLFLNHSILPRHLHGLPGSYVIITAASMLDELAPFVEMKREMGYLVNVFTLEEIGADPDNDEIRDFLLEKYEAIEPTPDLVLLVGDTRDLDGTRFVDYGYRGLGGTYASDNGYALFDDEDFIPDVLIGRFTVGNESDLETVVKKNYIYQFQPDLEGADWIKKGLVVSEDLHAMSPPLNAFWVKDILLQNGYTTVDTLVERSGYTPSPSLISSKINNGRSFITYRGWGSSRGWWNPEYEYTDVYGLSNSPYFCVLTTIVCGTADFRVFGTPSFAEVFLVAGTPSRPRGAVAVYGPSDHDTHTRYNNPLNVGFYEAVFGYDLNMLGQAALVSKLNEYLYLPIEMESVEHYFNVYNNIGDPGLYMWRGKLDSFTIDAPDTLVHWGGEFEVTVDPPIEGVWVTLYYDDTGMQAVGRTNAMGVATIAYPHEPEMFAKITAWKKDYKPAEKEVYIWRRGTEGIDFVSCTVDDYEGDGDGIMEPGETANLEFTLNNPGPYLSTGDFYLGSYTRGVEVVDGLNTTIINEGEFTINGYRISLDSGISHLDNLDLWLTVLQLDTIVRYHIPVDVPYSTGQLEISNYSYDGDLSIGGTANLDLEFTNVGEGSVGPIELRLITESGFITLSDNTFEIPQITPGSVYNADVDIVLMPHLVDGLVYPFIVVDSHGNTIGSFELSSGAGGPTGPDGWGYMAFDQTDTDYPDDIEWIDISTVGTANFIGDDWTIRREMPFPLRFYGDSYDSISICSNGWIAPGNISHYLYDFYNLPIPGPGGPWGTIAPMWDDLKPRDASGDEVLFTHYDTEHNAFIIQWNDLIHARYDVEQTFQVQIFDEMMSSGDNPIAFVYHTTTDDDSAHTYSSVGIEDTDHKIGLEYRYSSIYTDNSTPFTDDFGIYLTTDIGMARLSGEYYPKDIHIMTEYGQRPIKTNDDHYLFNQIRSGEDVFIHASADGYFREEQTFNIPSNTLQEHDFILEEIPMPNNLTALGNESSISFSWTAPVSTEHEITAFNIYRSRSPYGRIRYLASTASDITEFTDDSVDEGFYWYTVTAVFGLDESRKPEKVRARSQLAVNEKIQTPMAFGLAAPSPNPFNASVSLNVNLPEDAEIAYVKIFDATGHEVATYSAISGSININAETWGSGLYFARLYADTDRDFVSTRKMLLVK